MKNAGCEGSVRIKEMLESLITIAFSWTHNKPKWMHLIISGIDPEEALNVGSIIFVIFLGANFSKLMRIGMLKNNKNHPWLLQVDKDPTLSYLYLHNVQGHPTLPILKIISSLPLTIFKIRKPMPKTSYLTLMWDPNKICTYTLLISMMNCQIRVGWSHQPICHLLLLNFTFNS